MFFLKGVFFIKKIGVIVSFILFILTSIFYCGDNKVEAALGNSSGSLSKTYGGVTYYTPYITIDGIVAWCINPYHDFPFNEKYVETVMNDVGVYNILYYADLNGYDQNADDYVDVFVALNYYLGHFTPVAAQNDPTVKFLYNKAKNPDAPIGTFDIQNKTQTATYTSGNSYQETGWYKPVTDGSNVTYTVTVPSNITLITSDGQTKAAGTHTLKQNQNFKLRAPVNYEGSINLTVNTNILKQHALLFLPDNPNYQRLASMKRGLDPVSIPNVTAKFLKRTAKGNIVKRDKASGSLLQGATYQVKNTTTNKTTTVTTNENGTTSWGEATIGDKLTITETKAPTNYILNATPQSITVTSGKNDLSFYNEKKAELQLSKVQIYTDQAKNGLPIKIYTKRIQTSTTANQKTVQINVYETETTTKVLSLTYKIGELPSKIETVIPSAHLKVDQNKNYTVKIEGLDANYAYVTSGYGSIDTNGYSAAEKTVEVNAANISEISYKAVIMTERSIKENMKEYFESFKIPTNKLSKQKTGYGFSRDFVTTYTNDLQSRTNIKLKMTIDSDLVDSFLSQVTYNPTTDISLEQTLRKDFNGVDTRTFQLPHVNVEKFTGNLFYDSQVNNGDSRIKYDMRDGGRKFYAPIWADLGNYSTVITNVDPIGVNRLNIKIKDTLNLYAQMVATYDSDTKKIDEILISPVDSNNPFSNGIPDNFGYSKNGTRTLTDEEKAFFEMEVSNQTVSITYSGDGSNKPSNQTTKIGQEYMISTQIPTRTDYFFDGWQSSADGRIYQAGNSIKPVANVTLTSQWSKKKVGVTYDANGGIKAPVNENIDSGTVYTISADYPSREGYTFLGWKSTLDNKTYTPGTSMTLTKDVTFVAQWELTKRTVSYNANGGKNAPESVQVTDGTTYTISSKEPTRDGYSFQGWDYDRLYQSGEKVLIQNENIEFVAAWLRDEISIIYDGNGGSNVPDEDQAYAVGSYTISSTVPTMQHAKFLGWKNSTDNKLYQAGATINTATKTITLTAQWEMDQQTVSYNANGGKNAPSAQKVNVNATYTILSTVPTNQGYSFIGWEYDGKIYQPGDKLTMPENDITLVAQWEIARFDVSYNANGGAITPESGTAGNNVAYIIPTNAVTSRTGYTFKGWKNSVDGKIYQPGDKFTVINHTVLTAQWQINKYTVSYNLNGGSGSFSSVEQNYNTSFTVSSTKPTRTGYTFAGWKQSDTGTTIQPGSTFNIPANNVTLTAQWTINKYTVSYSLNGGSGTFNAVEQNYNTSFTVSSTKPTRSNYTFAGWKRSDTGAIVQAGGTFTIPANNVTLTAQWNPWQHAINYNLNGGSGTSDSQIKIYGVALSLHGAPTRSSYNFVGWKSSRNDVVYQAGANYTADYDGGSTTMTAQWSPWQHTIKYNLNGGSGTSSDQTKTYGSSLSLHGAPTRSGYSFAGWESSRNGTIYQAGANYTPDYNGGSTTMTAKWTANTHTVSYNLNGGSGTFNSTNANYDSSFKIPSTKPSKKKSVYAGWVQDGYRFAGWKNSVDGKVYQPGDSITIKGNTTLTAQWVEQVAYLYELVQYTPNIKSSAYGFATANDIINLVAGKPYMMETSGGVNQQARNDGKFLSVYLYLSDWSWSTSTKYDGDFGYPGTHFTPTKSGAFSLNGYLYPTGGSRLGVANWYRTTIYQHLEMPTETTYGTTIWNMVDKNGTITLPNPNGTRTGYTFTGWLNDADNKVYQPGAKVSVTSDKTRFSAQWSKNARYIFNLAEHNPEETSNEYGFATLDNLNLQSGKEYYTDTWGYIDQQAKNDGKDLQVSLYDKEDWSMTQHFTSVDKPEWKWSYFSPEETDSHTVSAFLYPDGGSRKGTATFDRMTIYQNDDDPENKDSGSDVWKNGYENKLITIPEPTASFAGKSFLGWRIRGTDKLLQPAEKYLLSSLDTIFEAQWQ